MIISYRIWKLPVPHIPKQWLDAVVYLYPSEDDARRGTRVGATGFVVSVPLENDSLPQAHSHHYVVTNAHAVEGQASLAVSINLKAGGIDVMTIPGTNWITHPDRDDVAAAGLPMNDKHQYAAINRSMMLTQELLEHWDFGPGDEVFFIGRYKDLEGKAHNVPTVRSGILSAFPAELIHQPQRGHDQETILIEARSLSGYSGSRCLSCTPLTSISLRTPAVLLLYSGFRVDHVSSSASIGVTCLGPGLYATPETLGVSAFLGCCGFRVP